MLPELADRIAAAAEFRTAPDGQADEEILSASWLADPRRETLSGLCEWLGQILIHYPDTVRALSPCWPRHPWIVEELVALQAAWREAYEGERASGTKAVDWHDRLRPGVVARLRVHTAGCSPEAHRPGGRLDSESSDVPGAAEIARLASGGRGASV
ncbi:hypothetical protein GCM10009557_34770 [Virgisporangium ochraceum]|uniref:Uncharacterized protein n=1 Tax=Virgisporangium ochraceum TaxID=65505 RepID=A0A8J3ZS73_9ACTN|nr:hypothetical protein [Virgisporangium ochraceum]GIJ68043.1 hypothetical protein Voc01_029600 [Virgisporangium ochraceum]